MSQYHHLMLGPNPGTGSLQRLLDVLTPARVQELSIAMWAAYSLGVAERKGSAQRAVKRMLQHGAREIRVRLAKDGDEKERARSR